MKKISISILLSLAFSTVADTVSNTIGIVERRIHEGETASVAFPAESPHSASAQFVKHVLSDASADGDLLHIWLSRHGATYRYVEAEADWHILESSTPMPAHRLQADNGQGFLISRKASGEGVFVFSGGLPREETIERAIPASSWRLVGSPFPSPLSLADIAAAGAQEGDRLRLWQRQAGTWLTLEWNGAAWEGEVPDLEIAVGEAFLYFNAGNSSRLLRFERPYALEETRP